MNREDSKIRSVILDMLMDASITAELNGDMTAYSYIEDIINGVFEIEDAGTVIDGGSVLLESISNGLGIDSSIILKKYENQKFGIALLNKNKEIVYAERGTDVESLLEGLTSLYEFK